MTMKTIVIRPDGSKEFTENILKRCQEDPRKYDPQIRRLARYENLVAMKSRKDGNWYFSDRNNSLQSPEQGMDDVEALEWLLQE